MKYGNIVDLLKVAGLIQGDINKTYMRDDDYGFVRERSPKGGNKLQCVNYWNGYGRVENNVKIETQEKPFVIDDFLCWHIGYASKDLRMGDKIFIKVSDAEHLCSLFKRQLEK